MNRLLIYLLIASVATDLVFGDQYDRPQYNQRIRQSPSSYRRYYNAPSTSLALAPDVVCSADADCAGYPLAYCEGVCRCVQGALNAGSTCISSGSAVQPAGSCPPGQTYVIETGSCMTVQQPGDPCQYSQQCAAAETGAFCLRLRCECVYGMRQSGTGCTFVDTHCTKRGTIYISELGECREVLPPGGRGCSHSLQCTAAYADATCFLQTCTCPPAFPMAIDGTCGRNCSAGETYSGVTGQCLPTVQPGDQCLYSSQCHAIYPGMVCERNRCRCPNGMVFSGTKCTQTCPTSYIVNSKGICMPGCRSNQVEYEGECLDQASPGSPCVVNAQCTGEASCQNSICTCPRAMIPRGNICVYAEAAPLESCRDGQVCTGGSFCSNGNCTCPVGRQIVNGQCVTPVTVPIGGNCLRVGVTCEGGSVCTSGHCLCPPGLSPVNNRCVQHRTAHPGEPCGNGEDCTGESQCNMMTRRCECIRESQMVIGKTCQERLRSHPGYPCSNNEICVGGSTCRQGRCACADNEISINKLCVKKPIVNPGDSCENGEDCSGDSECDYSQKRCVCRGGLEIVDGRCRMVSMISPGDSCSSNLVRCGGGSFCSQGRCECNTNYVAVNGKCTRQKHVSPGNACTAIDICTGKAQCRNGICHCPIGLVSRGGICEVKQKVLPMEPCLPGDECLGGSKCNGMICECAPGQVRRDDKCQERLRRKPGETCDPEDLCIGLSYCSKNVCKCKPNERIKDEKCVKKRQVPAGSKCSSDDICLGVSTCIDGICACPSGKALVGEQCKEIRTVALGRSCDDANVCASGSICDSSSKICKCPEGMQNSSGRCIKVVERPKPSIADPGMACRDGEQCRGGSVCKEGLCVCNEGLFINGNKCLPPVREQLATPSKELLTACPTDGSCKLPDCFCSESGTVPPGNLQPRDVPQMVILTFTDAITDRIINIYKTLFSGRFQNPNECAIKGTFFISHEFNNYDQTQWLYSRGNEIALNSITQENLMNATKERWYHEMVGIRESLRTFSYVEESSMKGIRAPHLLMGGDAQFSMMKENQFLYDNSMVVRDGPVWPQTLDHKLSWDCGNQNCPTVPFKGIWELPLQLLADNRGTYHPLAKNAIKPNDRQDNIQQMLLRNFYRNYNGNRAPFVLTADSDFLTYQSDNGVLHALEYFLEHILNKTDVYVVTASQAIQWMRKPTSLSNIKKFKPWHCNFRMNDHIQPCENPSTCSYHANNPAGRSHSFRVCGSCPKYYPWIEDPLGRKKFYRK